MNFRVTLAGVAGAMIALAISSSGRSNQAPVGAPTNNLNNLNNPTGADSSNPYAVIVDRNVFRLVPPPPPPEAPAPKPADLPKIFLTGIVKIGNDTRVLFAMPTKDAKVNTYFNLAQGEKDGVLELVKIYPEREAVDVVNSGTAMTLTIASNSITPVAAAGSAAPAGNRANGGAPPSYRGRAPQGLPGFSPAPAATVAGGSGYSPSSGSAVSVAGGGTPTSASSTPINGLFSSSQGGQTQIGNPVQAAVDPAVGAAALLLDKTMHGDNSPPLPPPLQNLLDGANEQTGNDQTGGTTRSGGPPALPSFPFPR